ncbi:ExbD/TolR family protein [Arachidicoccus terrestris]|jgi:biopolymer transport protein ExbD|uniref:ExbD/TolR family protein n=1 Tax=Arachidicoccus terrestris TaxID=2875539 RepID=UPI001CC622BC|nr:biopolymer transporter ExbD [Arachidicoccus terrestris]UAY56676.1 biopolymer transporter ExbD [Arachidicoccus terrestris]
MGRAKVKRKSTNVDMTAMCDVAFLLLTFFILTTKFKPDEKIPITTPSSVASKIAPEKNFILISLDKNGHAFLNSDMVPVKEQALDLINQEQNLGLTPGEIHKLAIMPVIGTSFNNLKAYSQLPNEQLNDKLPGIPIQDTANNQLKVWMKAFVSVQQGLGADDPQKKMAIILKGDNVAKFPEFKNVIAALTENSILEFQMVTNPEGVPSGTELWKKAQAEGATVTPVNG